MARTDIVTTGNNFKHGFHKTTEYRSWQHMKARCNNPNNHNYKYYGGRGIEVYEKWKTSFNTFIIDMGFKPSKDYSLDRIDTNGNYEPSNCKWSSKKEQAINRRTTKNYKNVE